MKSNPFEELELFAQMTMGIAMDRSKPLSHAQDGVREITKEVFEFGKRYAYALIAEDKKRQEEEELRKPAYL